MAKLNIACEGAAVLNLEEIEIIQGELKTLSEQNYEKLKTEMMERGFSFPFFIWKDGDKNYCLDGTQRKLTLERMKKDTYKEEPIEVPQKFPVCWIKAKDKSEAKKKLLAAVSQYGKVDKQGLYDFLVGADFVIDDISATIDIPEIDLDVFKYEFFEKKAEQKVEQDVDTTNESYDKYLTNNIKQIVLYIEGKDFEPLVDRLNKKLVKYSLDDYSALLVRLLDEDDRTEKKPN